MNKHKNEKMLLVGLVLVVLIGVVAGVVFADGLEVMAVAATGGTIVEVIASPSVEGLVLTAAGTGVATDENGTPACEEWLPQVDCVFPSERVLPSNEPIRWWSGCRCEVVGPPEDQREQYVCREPSFCGRTREASDLVNFASAAPTAYLGNRPLWVGRRGSVNFFAIARFYLGDVPVEEIEKVVVSLEGLHVEGLSDDATLKVELLSYVAGDVWRKPGYGYWYYVQNRMSLGTIYEVSADYLRAVTREDGTVPTLGFRFPDGLVPGVENAVRCAHAQGCRYRSLFVRVSMAGPEGEESWFVEFDQALLTVVPEGY